MHHSQEAKILLDYWHVTYLEQQVTSTTYKRRMHVCIRHNAFPNVRWGNPELEAMKMVILHNICRFPTPDPKKKYRYDSLVVCLRFLDDRESNIRRVEHTIIHKPILWLTDIIVKWKESLDAILMYIHLPN